MIHREVKDRDRHRVAAVEIVVAELEIVADEAAVVAANAVEGTNDLTRRDRHAPKSVRAVMNLVLPTHPPRLLEVNPVIRLLGQNVMIARVMIVAREQNDALIVTHAGTNRDQPVSVHLQLQRMLPMISGPAFLENHRLLQGHLPFRNSKLRRLVLHARKRSRKAPKPQMRCCVTQLVQPGNR